MVYRGKIQNGVVVFNGTPRLPEGTDVEVVPATPVEPSTEPRRGSLEAILPFAGIWADQAEEMDRSLAELRQMKTEELRRQLSQPDPELSNNLTLLTADAAIANVPGLKHENWLL